ncbi:MAG: FtsX-like permease family protein [Phycisphaeraceae bacterium]|nr:FtsX-like permease family protein [Phycisphaeraceae bacterium]
MTFVALRMLTGDRAKFLGILFGITFASLLITQQVSIFIGLMTRTFGFVTDTAQPDIWVMDPKVQFIDDIKPMQDTQLLRVRGVAGVQWAMPLYKGLIQARMENGTFQNCNVIGIDDATLIGGPATMVQGRLEDLRASDSVIVDIVGARTRLAKPAPGAPRDEEGNIPADWPRIPLEVGDTLELNDRRAVVVGFCEVSRTFQSQPVIYTTYGRATQYAPRQRKLLSYVLVKAEPGRDVQNLCRAITEQTGLAAYTGWDFSRKTYMYFMKYTGIPINFGIAVALGFLVGTAIAGQTFYNFTLDNLRHFGALKAMGAGNGRLLGMIVLQSLVVGALGYGLGVGAATLFGVTAARNSELAFRLLPHTLVGTGVAVLLICVLASLLSIVKVIRLEPAIVFKS